MNSQLVSINVAILLIVISCDFVRQVCSSEQNCLTPRFANGRTRPRPGSKGRIIRFNCIRNFQLVGSKYATCMRGRWDAEPPICVKPGCFVTTSARVNGQFLESYRGAVVKVICNPGYTLIGSPTVYCNGVRWNQTFPSCKVTNQNPALSCDFENVDLCGWSQDPLHDFDWKRQNGSTPSGHVGTGPTSDHTYGQERSGHYMYIESSSPRMVNDSARLYSPVYPSELSANSCFSFSYHMYGATTGSLKVYVKQEGRELSNTIPSYWINGEQGQSWIRGFFLIEHVMSPFQIVIEGIRGNGSVSDTAFDDVSIKKAGECLEEATTSTLAISDPDDGDYDEMTCKGRCGEDPVFDGTSARWTLILESAKCDCHSRCVDNSTCCNDYYDFCSFPAVTALSTEIEATSGKPSHPPNRSSSTINSKYVTGVTARAFVDDKTIRNATRKPSSPTRLTTVPFQPPNNESNDVPKFPTESPKTRNPVLSPSTGPSSPVQLKNISGSKNKTDKPFSITTSRTFTEKRTTHSTAVTEMLTLATRISQDKGNPSQSYWTDKAKLPLVVNPSKSILNSKPRILEVPARAAGKGLPQAIKSGDENRKLDVPLTGIVGMVAATLLLLGTAAVAGVVILRRRKRRSHRDNMAEYSDVRYLTSDQVFDFTLAQPADDDL